MLTDRYQSTSGNQKQWAVIAGASEGLGKEFGVQLALKHSFNLFLIARSNDKLNDVKKEILEGCNNAIEVKTLVLDLALLGAEHDTDVGATTTNATKSRRKELSSRRKLQDAIDELEDISFLVYNAAFSPIGPFKSTSIDNLLKAARVNVEGPLVLVHSILPRLLERKIASSGKKGGIILMSKSPLYLTQHKTNRNSLLGGIILMSSLSGVVGSANIATYAATKAFNTILAEGLSAELVAEGIDVLACVAGGIRTPGFILANPGKAPPGTLDPKDVVSEALSYVGYSSSVIPGWFNAIATFFLTRLLPRSVSISIIAANTKNLV